MNCEALILNLFATYHIFDSYNSPQEIKLTSAPQNFHIEARLYDSKR